MGIENTKNSVAMHCLSLIQRSYDPDDASDYHPNAIAGGTNQMVIVGFVELALHEQKAYDFSAQHIRDWVNHIPPETQDEHTETIPLPNTL